MFLNSENVEYIADVERKDVILLTLSENIFSIKMKVQVYCFYIFHFDCYHDKLPENDGKVRSRNKLGER